MSNKILKTLDQLRKGLNVLLQNQIKQDAELEKSKFEGMICKASQLEPLNGLWKLEFINRTPFTIRVLKVSAESYLRTSCLTTVFLTSQIETIRNQLLTR